MIISSLNEYLPLGSLLSLVRGSHVAIACLVVLVVRLIYSVYLYPRYYSPLRHVPGPSLGAVIMGQARALVLDDVGTAQLEWVKQYGPAVRVVGPIGIERLMFIRPESLHKMMVEDWVENPRPPYVRKILGLVTGYGLLTVTGNEHRMMRKAMLPAFSIQHLQAQADLYHEPIENLVDIMNIELNSSPTPGSVVLRTYDFMSRVTLDIICRSAFGYDSNSLNNPSNELAAAYHSLVSLQSGWNLTWLIILVHIPFFESYVLSKLGWYTRNVWRWLPGSSWKCIGMLIDAMHTIKRVSRGVLDERMREALVVGVTDVEAKRDIMSLLVRARMSDKDETAYKMNDDQMMDQVLTFLGAGHETTASGLAWTLWLLATNLQAQAKLRQELLSKLTPDAHPDYRTLTKDLPYLDAVITESLRVLPPVPVIVRKTMRETVIDGIRVPKNTQIYVPVRVHNMWHELWGVDAELFRPERWLDGSPTQSGPGMTFITGPHGCIGKTMAVVEMKAVIAALISNFTFEPAYAGQKIKPATAVTMKPADEMPLRVTRLPMSPRQGSPI